MNTDLEYMGRALDLAILGKGHVAPNPMVGALIVSNKQIIGEGYHMAIGRPHAEVNAIQSVNDKTLLQKATMYVNLEPCNHTGLTPPCTDLILKHSIPRVVIGQKDPNPKVSGSGIERLKKRGVEVSCGIKETEALELNRRFNTFHGKKRPYIILKWAQSSDGYIDAVRKEGDPIQPNWITDEFCRRIVHKWRSEESAIMVGTETALKDNPKLNLRSWKGKNPLRIVVDQKLRLPKSLNLFDGSIPTLIYTSKSILGKSNTDCVQIDFEKGILDPILEDLYQRKVQSLIVEGGQKLLASFIDQELWDEARIFTGPVEFSDGVKAPEFNHTPLRKTTAGNSILEIFRNG